MLRAHHPKITGERPALAWANVPSWRAVATVAGIAITAVLILELGIWYFVGLIAIYAALDVAQRIEMRREARMRMAILAADGHHARSVSYRGQRRHCHRAAWVAKRMGWIACPMEREGMLRHAVRFRYLPGAEPLHLLLTALNEEKLATRIRLLDFAPSFGKRLAEQGYWDIGRDI